MSPRILPTLFCKCWKIGKFWQIFIQFSLKITTSGGHPPRISNSVGRPSLIPLPSRWRRPCLGPPLLPLPFIHKSQFMPFIEFSKSLKSGGFHSCQHICQRTQKLNVLSTNCILKPQPADHKILNRAGGRPTAAEYERYLTRCISQRLNLGLLEATLISAPQGCRPADVASSRGLKSQQNTKAKYEKFRRTLGRSRATRSSGRSLATAWLL